MKKNKLIICFGALLLIFVGIIIFYFYNEKNINSINCEEGFKKWHNKTYGYGMCLPENWKARHGYGHMIEFNDSVVEIGKEIPYTNNFEFPIRVENESSLLFEYTSGFEYLLISDIRRNKIFLDQYKGKDGTEMIYNNTVLILKSGDIFSSFFYDKNNKDHKKIIESIKIMK